MTEQEKLSDVVTRLGITCEAKHLYLDESPEWQCDVWRATLTFEGRTHTATYRTGLGHRKLVPWGHAWHKGDLYGSDTVPTVRGPLAAAKAGLLLAPKAVAAADVLGSLLSDASSATETFADWCDSFGYTADSRKALATYLECQTTLVALRKFLGVYYAECAEAEH